MQRKHLISSLLCSMFLFTGQQAYATTYYLTQSNTLADGVNYAQVDVVESGGNLDFTVTALAPTNWKFSDFYYNLNNYTGVISYTGLPTGWTADTDQNVSEFGVFSDGASGTGNSLVSVLSFTADGTTAISLADLMVNTDGWIFASHIQCQDKTSSPCSAVDGQTSTFIAGPGSPVPIPGAIWLFGSALMGFINMSNRRKV